MRVNASSNHVPHHERWRPPTPPRPSTRPCPPPQTAKMPTPARPPAALTPPPAQQANPHPDPPANIPLPRTALDHAFFPHIFDRILAYAEPSTLVYLRACSRATQARCEAALFRYMRVCLRRVAPTPSTAEHTPTSASAHTVEFCTPDEERLRVPGMYWDVGGPGEAMCLYVLATSVRVLDIELFHDDALTEWFRFLHSAEDLRRAMCSVEILRRVYGPSALPVSIESPNALFGRGGWWR